MECRCTTKFALDCLKSACMPKHNNVIVQSVQVFSLLDFLIQTIIIQYINNWNDEKIEIRL